MNTLELKELLDKEVKNRNRADELDYEHPDPLMVASRYKDEKIALICALFAYGNAKQIVKFLDSLDFDLINSDENSIRKNLRGKYYRFQKEDDVIALFIALNRLDESIQSIVERGFEKQGDIRDGLWELIERLKSIYPYQSQGYDFLIGKIPKNPNNCAPFKRYMMYFRWMLRSDNLDMGLWKSSKIEPKDLIIPLDTHTHKVSLKLGLLKRKSYDMKAALELTDNLKKFDKEDPVKYDFAIYRIGQENIAIKDKIL